MALRIELPFLSTSDDDKLNYAVGLLMGLYHKYGDMNVVLYHERIRVQVQWIGRQMVEEDL